MSEPIPDRADIRQLRTQAKELLRSIQTGEIIVDEFNSSDIKLAHAQLLIARKYGFESWTKLVLEIETPLLLERFKHAVEQGDSFALEDLLKSKAVLRRKINDPMFSFGTQAIIQASTQSRAKELIPVLIRYGANPNIRSDWWAGGFSALDLAKGDVVDLLLTSGANLDIWSAASHGQIDVVNQLLDKDPTLVNAPGGDGETPLHFASTPEIALLLIELGANLEQRDVDHEGTPAQHHVLQPEILKVLLDHGAKPDIFTAIALGDAALVRKILSEDSESANAEIGSPPFVTQKSNGGHIYTYLLGPHKTPLQFAAHIGNREILNELLSSNPPSKRLIAAAWLEDENDVRNILRQYPNLTQEMGSDARSITDAAQAGKTETVRILLEAGIDPETPGLDSGTALHTACWFGYKEIVKLLIGKVPLELTDSVHGSPPLGWAAHGSQWCRNASGDYVGTVRTLLEAGADPNAPANKGGATMLNQAGQRDDVKDILREFGAK